VMPCRVPHPDISWAGPTRRIHWTSAVPPPWGRRIIGAHTLRTRRAYPPRPHLHCVAACAADRTTTTQVVSQFNEGWPVNSWEITEPSIGYQAQYILVLARYVR